MTEAHEAAVLAAVSEVPRLGWALAAARAEPPFAGAADLLAAFAAMTDRWMTEDAAAADLLAFLASGAAARQLGAPLLAGWINAG